MLRLLPAGALLVALGACAVPAPPRPAPVPAPPSPPIATVGLERVVGRTAPELVQLFGPADADVREGPARKLQFVGRICVLDAYLYPKDGGDQRVTWIDAREPDGSPLDRASCIAALVRREGGR